MFWAKTAGNKRNYSFQTTLKDRKKNTYFWIILSVNDWMRNAILNVIWIF